MDTDNISQKIADEIVALIDQQTKRFLERNNIPFTNIEETQALLRERGYRLIDEIEGAFMQGSKHTLLLVKIIDQTSYEILPPKIELPDTK